MAGLPKLFPVPGVGDQFAQPVDAMQAGAPFVWGQGGARLTPDELARRQAIAQGLMQSDYSPVGSAWEGLGRVADNWLGAIQSKKLDKQATANKAESDAVMQALLAGNGGNGAVSAALTNPYISPEVRDFAKMEYGRLNPKPTAPHYWETNNGSLGMVGPDGQPQIIYNDPTPKIDWMQARDPATGQITLYPMQQGGGGPVSGAAPGGNPPASLPPDFDFGGPTQPASGGFR